ncbi:MAG: hypothetical protein ACI39W_08755 [Brotaphodocola sp.]
MINGYKIAGTVRIAASEKEELNSNILRLLYLFGIRKLKDVKLDGQKLTVAARPAPDENNIVMYWWNASDEVVLSEDTVRWLEELAAMHRKLMEKLSDLENEKSEFLKEFIMLLSETDQYYHRIFPFKDMFYEFIRNIHRKEFRAAVELFRVLTEENRGEGKIIEKALGAPVPSIDHRD